MGFLRNLIPANESPPGAPGNDDAALVARAQRGDSQAFALLYRRYLDQVYTFAANRLESREAAEDATQAIFLKAVASLPQCRDGERFAGWLFAIARNVVNDQYRTRPIATQPLEDPNHSPERLAEQAEASRELADLRERCLDAGERELLDLRLLGLNDREIADALGRSHGAVRTAQYRMVQKLRDCMELPSVSKEVAHEDRKTYRRGPPERLLECARPPCAAG